MDNSAETAGKHPSRLEGFEFVGGRLCLDFVNTRAGPEAAQPREILLSYARFLDWCDAAGTVSGSVVSRIGTLARKRQADAAETLAETIMARDAFCALLENRIDGRPVVARDLGRFNRIYSRALGARRLVSSSTGFALAWEDEGTSLEAPLWPLLESAAVLLCNGDLSRVKRCRNLARCGWFFYDASKNRSRRWCSMRACGNAEKARRHYRRHRSHAAP